MVYAIGIVAAIVFVALVLALIRRQRRTSSRELFAQGRPAAVPRETPEPPPTLPYSSGN